MVGSGETFGNQIDDCQKKRWLVGAFMSILTCPYNSNIEPVDGFDGLLKGAVVCEH